jgi:hypothetical protein
MLALGQFAEVRRNLRLALSPSPRPVYPCMGRILSRGAARVLSIFSSLSFFVRRGSRFFVPTHADGKSPAPRRSGQGWRISATRKGLSLTDPSTTAHLYGRDDEVEGEFARGARMFVSHPCIRRSHKTPTMMQ